MCLFAEEHYMHLFFLGKRLGCLHLSPWMTFTLSGTLVVLCASQSKSNFPEMFSHHVDNQALIASDIAYHLPIVTQKTAHGMSNYPQVSNNERVLWKQVVYCLSRQKPQLPSSQPRQHAARCRASSAFRAMLLCAHLINRKSMRMSNLKAFIHSDVNFSYTASLSQHHHKIPVEVINLQCANHGPRCGILMRMWLNAVVSDSRELCRPTWQRCCRAVCGKWRWNVS